MSTEQIVVGIFAVIVLFAALFSHMDERQIIRQLKHRLSRFAGPNDPPGPHPTEKPALRKSFDPAAPYDEMVKQLEGVKFDSYHRPKWSVKPLQDRSVRLPQDVWAELQAMPNDGSWSTRQLVRAIQRANKKKGDRT